MNDYKMYQTALSRVNSSESRNWLILDSTPIPTILCIK